MQLPRLAQKTFSISCFALMMEDSSFYIKAELMTFSSCNWNSFACKTTLAMSYTVLMIYVLSINIHLNGLPDIK